MQKAYSDEPFLLLPELKSLTSHSIHILDSTVEVRHPIRRVDNSLPSQLRGCTMYHESVGNECYALEIGRKDLTSATSIDMQDLVVGKYVVKWVRVENIQNKDEAELQEMAAVSTFELQSVTVCQSSLFAAAKLPPYAVARTPFGVTYSLVNRTDIVLEFNLTMESSEAFMLAGNKQQHFKIPPGRTHDLNYVLYPLLAGEAVALPRPKLNSLRPALPHDDVGATLQRLLPSHITGKQRQLSSDKTLNFARLYVTSQAFIKRHRTLFTFLLLFIV